MNYKVLQKCLDALNSENPDLSYIKGMIEVLLAMEPAAVVPALIPTSPQPGQITPVSTQVEDQPVNEAELLDKLAKARLKEAQEGVNYE